jgi:hypothetical protein
MIIYPWEVIISRYLVTPKSCRKFYLLKISIFYWVKPKSFREDVGTYISIGTFDLG